MPRASPRTNAVFPAPSSPERRTTSPPANRPASAAATSSVSAADRVTRDVIAARASAARRAAAAIRSLAVSETSPSAARGLVARRAVDVHRAVAAVHASVPAGEQGAHDPGQHVAGAGGGHPGVAGGVDRGAAVGAAISVRWPFRTTTAPVAAAAPRARSRGGGAWTSAAVDAGQPRHLARMGREDGRRGPRRSEVGADVPDERVQRVGVDDDGHRALARRSRARRPASPGSAEAGAEHDRVAGLRQRQRAHRRRPVEGARRGRRSVPRS